jgi:hypothetical protein
VTEFRVDEGIADPRKSLRATEARNARDGQIHSYWLPLQNQQAAALWLRFREKIEKATGYEFRDFEDVWLLVAASVTDERATAGTFLVEPFMNVEVLNAELDDALQRSKYRRAYLYPMLGAKIYEWSNQTRWRCVDRRIARCFVFR